MWEKLRKSGEDREQAGAEREDTKRHEDGERTGIPRDSAGHMITASSGLEMKARSRRTKRDQLSV